MKKTITYSFLALACCLLFMQKTNAQVSSIPFTASLDTFAPITGTTVDALNADDMVYQNLPIGFNFSLGGKTCDKMSISTNGCITLDSTGTSLFFNILSGSFNNIVSPFGADLIHHNANASLQYVTLGTAPNRVTIVQWLHYSYFNLTGDFNFQVWLYETSNCIRYVYGTNNIGVAPMQTQIGLRGDSISDFLVLGDTTCNWANAYPFTSINTTFPVSSSCSMPSGFAFHFGSCGYGSTINFAYMTGKVFNDLNGNGTLDPLEPPIANHVVNLLPGNYYVSSDATGSYAFFFFDSTLTYSLSTGGITYWNQTNSPAIITCNPQTQSTSGLNFGFQVIPNIHEVAISCPNWGAKPGQPEPMPIGYSNNGTSTESDTITFVMDSLYSFISSTPAPTVINGKMIQWAYTNLLPNHSGYIMLNLMPDSAAVLGNFLNSTLSIAPFNDTIPTNNVLNLHQLISNSWDPNEKDAQPSGMIAAGTEINYTIHFQNTGNAAAANVTVKDTLDATNLDLLTFRLTGSSHPVNFTMNGNGIATFTFYNIQLPDSGSNLEGSNGSVSYAVKTRSTLTPLTVINNTAGIIFDSNIPVMTNTTADTIQLPFAIDNYTANTFYLSASPNPVKGNVVFVFSNNANEKAELRITTIEGKLMMMKSNITSKESIDISSLPQGIYLCTVNSATGTRTVKMVKQ
ncbi:MAG: T9SS type A sorting domain-containing protein [Bacteroidia bacterium]